MLYELSNCENKISLTKVFFYSPFSYCSPGFYEVIKRKISGIHEVNLQRKLKYDKLFERLFLGKMCDQLIKGWIRKKSILGQKFATWSQNFPLTTNLQNLTFQRSSWHRSTLLEWYARIKWKEINKIWGISLNCTHELIHQDWISCSIIEFEYA